MKYTGAAEILLRRFSKCHQHIQSLVWLADVIRPYLRKCYCVMRRGGYQPPARLPPASCQIKNRKMLYFLPIDAKINKQAHKRSETDHIEEGKWVWDLA